MFSNTEKRFLFAVKALMFFEDKFLLVRRGAGARKAYHGHWELPGGRLEFGESPEQTLKREVFEETKLTFEPIRLLDTWFLIKDFCTQLVGVIYLCVAHSDKVCLSSEHDAYEWISPAAIGNYKISEHLLINMQRWNLKNIEREKQQYVLRCR